MAIVLSKPVSHETVEIIETIRVCQELHVVPSVLENEDPLWIERIKIIMEADSKRATLEQERAKAQAERDRHGAKS
jgi:hypothetical protein